MPTSDPKTILSQDAWLRRIARRLASDPELVDDLVQDTWVASLQAGERRRPWLAGVLRNVSVSGVRSAASRREQARRASELARKAFEPTDEIAADLELRERVAQALRAMEEPYRTALHQRFVSDLSVKEIARRTGVSPSAASERITRGLALLKSRLDRAYNGDRRAWSMLLLPMARPEGLAALATGMLAMTTTTKWTLAASAACLLLFSVTQWRSIDPGPGSHETAGASATDVVPPGQPQDTSVELASISRPDAARSERASASSDPTDEALSPEAVAGPQARVKGRFQLPDGRPASGARWKVSGWPANDEAVRTHGLPESWERREGQLNPSGDVDVTFEAPGAFQFTFEVSSPGCVDASWRWSELVAGETKDLGEVTLRPAARISGTLIGPDGQPLAGGGWRVHVEEERERWQPSLEGWEVTRKRTAVDPETAAFTVDGMPVGRASLHATHNRFGQFAGPELDIPADGARDVTFRIQSLVQEETSVIVEFDFESALGDHPLDPAHVALLDGRGARTSPSRHPSHFRAFLFEDVGEGAMRLVVDDPAFVRETREGVRAGDRLNVSMRGSATLALDVRGADGGPVPLYALELESIARDMAPRLRVHSGEEPLELGQLIGVVPGDYRLFVRTNDSSAAVDIVGLGAGEMRPVVVELDGSTTIQGRATFADGTSAAKIRARLLTPAEVNDGPGSFVVSEFAGGGIPEESRHEIDRKTTDSDGHFRLAAPGPGRYLVMLGEDTGARSESSVFEVVEGVVPKPLKLVATRAARIRGRIDVPAGLDLTGWRVVPFWPDMGVTFQTWFQPAAVNSEGAFELPKLSPGRLELYLLAAGYPMSWGGEGGSPTHGRPMAQLTLRDGETLERIFPFPGGLPSQVTFEVALSGAPDGDCSLRVNDATVLRTLTTVRGTTPTIGPLLMDAGVRSLALQGDGWAWMTPEPITIPEGETMALELQVQLMARPLLLLHEGEPVRGAKVRIVQNEARLSLGLESDAEGRIDVRLGPGRYDLWVLPTAPGEASRSLPLPWPPAGEGSTLTIELE